MSKLIRMSFKFSFKEFPREVHPDFLHVLLVSSVVSLRGSAIIPTKIYPMVKVSQKFFWNSLRISFENFYGIPRILSCGIFSANYSSISLRNSFTSVSRFFSEIPVKILARIPSEVFLKIPPEKKFIEKHMMKLLKKKTNTS